MNNILFKAEDCIINVRTMGVLVKNGKILIQWDKDGNEYSLPSGHIKLGETTTDRLVRGHKKKRVAHHFWKFLTNYKYFDSFIMLSFNLFINII